MTQKRTDGFSVEPVETAEQVTALAALANEIWSEHYRPIIGEEQTRYMVENFQSAEAVTKQLAGGYRYFFLRLDGVRAGYIAVTVEPDVLFLSKLYVAKEFRRRGIAKFAVSEVKRLAREAGRDKIRLTVNRYNAGSIAAYERMGFVRTRELKTDIGSGYIMDDYVYELTV